MPLDANVDANCDAARQRRPLRMPKVLLLIVAVGSGGSGGRGSTAGTGGTLRVPVFGSRHLQ